jgi:hypothetical protein
VIVKLFPFRDEPEIPKRELFELAKGERTKGLFVGCSFGSRQRLKIILPRNATKSVDQLELRWLKMPLDGRSLGAKSSAVKRVAEMVTQKCVTYFAMEASEATKSSAVKRFAEMVTHEYVTRFAIEAAGATDSSAVKRVAEMVTQEYVIRFAIQAAEETIAIAIFGRLHDKSKVDRNTLIAVSSLAVRIGRLAGFVELGLEAERTFNDPGGDRKAGYPNSVLVHVTDKVRIHIHVY